MDRPDLDLLTASFRDDPVLDIALTHALLREVGAGRRPPALRIFRPGPTAAFGKLDRLLPGLAAACARARALGRTPLIRLAGGRAAVYDERCVVVEHISAEDDSTAGLQARFEAQARHLRRALLDLGADARIGELPGEYCPGTHSINVAGTTKVAGIAQRTIRGAALTTAVIVVGGGAELRTAVAEIYGALGRAVDPGVAGSVDEARSGLDADAVAARVWAAYAASATLSPQTVGDDLLARAERLRAEHAAP